MAENKDGQEKTEEATPERREEFRQKGQVAVSREITGVATLIGSFLLISVYLPEMMIELQQMFSHYFLSSASLRVDSDNVLVAISSAWMSFLKISLFIGSSAAIVAVVMTFVQTRMNWSWKKLKPDFSKINPLKGLTNLVNSQALVNLLKSIGKMLAVGLMAYLILYSEVNNVVGLVNIDLMSGWQYWGEINVLLFWGVGGLLLIIGGGDYVFNYFKIEQQLKMSKQELKEEMKKHELDPHLKSRIKRAQRDIAFAKNVRNTREATVVITNPTHFAVALKYELGMSAPVVVAKGTDHLALFMRQAAKESKVPVIENKPLARLLHASVEIGREIPENLYRLYRKLISMPLKLRENQ